MRPDPEAVENLPLRRKGSDTLSPELTISPEKVLDALEGLALNELQGGFRAGAMFRAQSAASNSLASIRSGVPKPSVNQP